MSAFLAQILGNEGLSFVTRFSRYRKFSEDGRQTVDGRGPCAVHLVDRLENQALGAQQKFSDLGKFESRKFLAGDVQQRPDDGDRFPDR